MASRREVIDVMNLEAIAEFCDKITDYVKELAIDRENFLKTSRHQDLCAFYCLQIGEYAGSLSNEFRDSHPEIEWRKIIGFRNNIAHEYGSMDPEILWDSIEHNIPELRAFCAGQIGKE